MNRKGKVLKSRVGKFKYYWWTQKCRALLGFAAGGEHSSQPSCLQKAWRPNYNQCQTSIRVCRSRRTSARDFRDFPFSGSVCWCKVCRDVHTPCGGLRGGEWRWPRGREAGGPMSAVVWVCVSCLQGPGPWRIVGQAPTCVSRASFLGNVSRAFPM